jgi:YgiT-type zinc finger domain-containing protein
MSTSIKCSLCGGKVAEKSVEKLLRGGHDTAVVTVSAGVCKSCGKRQFSDDTIKHLKAIRAKLVMQEVGEFQLLGRSFQVV